MTDGFLKQLDLHDFLKDSKSYIFMYFNVETIKNHFVKVDSPEKLLYWAHFMAYSPEENRSYFLKLDQKCDFYNKDRLVDFPRAHQIILKAKEKWEKFCPLPFPDIMIHKTQGASYSPEESKPGLIKLSLEELDNLYRLEFVLGHELGHYYYNHFLKPEDIKTISRKSYMKENPFYCLMVATLFICNIGTQISLFQEPTLPVWVAGSIISLMSLSMFYVAFLEIPQWFSYRERLKNYSQEFYSDHFAQWFSDKRVGEQDHHLVGGDLTFNVYTHPGANERIKNLLNNTLSTPRQWNNPVFLQPYKFSRSSFYEIEFFWQLLLKRAGSEIMYFLKKLKTFCWDCFANKSKKSSPPAP